MDYKKAQDYIDDVKMEIGQAKSSLETAKSKAEKTANKQVIEHAIETLTNACDTLCEYKD